jgi:hypothetical protein
MKGQLTNDLDPAIFHAVANAQQFAQHSPLTSAASCRLRAIRFAIGRASAGQAGAREAVRNHRARRAYEPHALHALPRRVQSAPFCYAGNIRTSRAPAPASTANASVERLDVLKFV